MADIIIGFSTLAHNAKKNGGLYGPPFQLKKDPVLLLVRHSLKVPWLFLWRSLVR